MTDILWQAIRVDEKLDWSFDWDINDWIGSETISSSEWTIEPAGPTLSGQTFSNTPDRLTTVTITGCEFGKTYLLHNKIVDTAGRIGKQTITLRCVGP